MGPIALTTAAPAGFVMRFASGWSGPLPSSCSANARAYLLLRDQACSRSLRHLNQALLEERHADGRGGGLAALYRDQLQASHLPSHAQCLQAGQAVTVRNCAGNIGNRLVCLADRNGGNDGIGGRDCRPLAARRHSRGPRTSVCRRRMAIDRGATCRRGWSPPARSRRYGTR
jgi:hypothetical protein